FFFQAEDGIRDFHVTGVQTCALPIFPDTEFDVYIDDITQRLAQQPTYALALTKQALQRSAENTIDQQLELEQNLQYLALNSQDYKEGVQAFFEKRPAQFTGC